MSSTTGTERKSAPTRQDGKNEANVGKIQQVIGPTVDVEFRSDQLPNILNAIKVRDEGKKIDLTLEVAMHVGDNVVRCIAMASTDGLVRGMPAVDTGAPRCRSGRNAWAACSTCSASRSTAKDLGYRSQAAHPSPCADPGRAVHQHRDLRDRYQGRGFACPVFQGGQGRSLWRRRCGKDGHHPGAHPQHCHRARWVLGVLRGGRAYARRERSLPGNDRVRRQSTRR